MVKHVLHSLPMVIAEKYNAQYTVFHDISQERDTGQTYSVQTYTHGHPFKRLIQKRRISKGSLNNSK